MVMATLDAYFVVGIAVNCAARPSLFTVRLHNLQEIVVKLQCPNGAVYYSEFIYEHEVASA